MRALTPEESTDLAEQVQQLLKISNWHTEQALNTTTGASSRAADTAAQLASTATELAGRAPGALDAVLNELHGGLSLLLNPQPSRRTVRAAQRHESYARTRVKLHEITHGLSSSNWC